MGAGVSISHWFFIDFSLLMTLWAWLVFMFTEQSFIWCIYWKKFLPKFGWRFCLLSWRAGTESESWRLDSYELVHVNSSVDLTNSFGMGTLWCQRLGTKLQYFLFMWSLTVTLLPRTLGGEGRGAGWQGLLHISPPVLTLFLVTWHFMTYDI